MIDATAQQLAKSSSLQTLDDEHTSATRLLKAKYTARQTSILKSILSSGWVLDPRKIEEILDSRDSISVEVG